MTVRDFYRNILIELNKEEASALYVEDFLYFANKAVSEYVNSRYNLYDTSQQLGDDLRVLKEGPELIDITKKDNLNDLGKHDDPNKPYLRYRHLLNCIVETKLLTFNISCDNEIGDIIKYPAKRMTSDRKGAILNNAFLEEAPHRPYYDIIGHTLTVANGSAKKSSIEKVTVEYLRNPKIFILTNDLLTNETDNSDTIEFPDYVIYELIKGTVKFIMEQSGDPRLQTNPMVNQSVGPIPPPQGK